MNGTPAIRRARPDEAARLSDLAMRSKAVWGYDADFMETSRDELTTGGAQIADHFVFVAEVGVAEAGQHLAGFYILVADETAISDPATAEVAALFIDPRFIRQGIGRVLWRHLVAIAREHGIRALELDSDPCAEPFYRKMGCERIGESASGPVAGRMLPRLRLAL